MTRSPDIALTYLRRSTGRQEASLDQQLDWASDAAPHHGVNLDVTRADLHAALAARVHARGDLYLDDGVTGADLNRPGFTAMLRRAIDDRRVSHVFVYLPDRFARPEDALAAMQLERELLLAGVTVVFSNRVSQPRDRGRSYFAEDVQLLYNYSESGEFLNTLAQRIIARHVSLAEDGCRTGGRPPYGYSRVLVDAAGNVVQELRDGTYVRQEGCHVRLRVADEDKIRVWAMMLNWYVNERLGAKRIANRLNALGIPSPGVGQTRTDCGIEHRVSGRWNHGTVMSLLRNPAIVGLARYGAHSEGAHRRLGDGAPRVLSDADRRADGTARPVRNPPERIITAPAGHAAQVDPALFEAAAKVAEARGRSQRGIPRAKDPTRYPLASRVFDLTDGCGHPMYGKTSGRRALYVCGRYMKTNGDACEHNSVDAEATLAFVLDALKQQAIGAGGREALAARLRELARDAGPAHPDADEAFRRAGVQAAAAASEYERVGRNFALAQNDEERRIFRETLSDLRAKHLELEAHVRRLKAAVQPSAAPDAAVEEALALYDEIGQVGGEPEARRRIPALLSRMNLRLWLNFTQGRKGARAVRVLAGGVMTLGDAPPPVRPYGRDAVDDDDPAGGDGDVVVGPTTNHSGGTLPPHARGSKPPPAKPEGSAEGGSFTKVSRDDRI